VGADLGLVVAAGPAAVALPVGWTAKAVTQAGRKWWWKRSTGRDDSSRLVSGVTADGFELTGEEFVRLRDLLMSSIPDCKSLRPPAKRSPRAASSSASRVPTGRPRTAPSSRRSLPELRHRPDHQHPRHRGPGQAYDGPVVLDSAHTTGTLVYASNRRSPTPGRADQTSAKAPAFCTVDGQLILCWTGAHGRGGRMSGGSELALG